MPYDNCAIVMAYCIGLHWRIYSKCTQHCGGNIWPNIFQYGLMCHGTKITMLSDATNVPDAAIKCHNPQRW